MQADEGEAAPSPPGASIRGSSNQPAVALAREFSSKKGRILKTLLMRAGTTSNPQDGSCLGSPACFNHVSQDTYHFSWN